jgi:hypothetical protein
MWTYVTEERWAAYQQGGSSIRSVLYFGVLKRFGKVIYGYGTSIN